MRDKMPGKQLQSHCGLARLVIWEGGMVGRCREFFTLRPSILGKDSCSCCHSIAPTLVQLKLHEMWYILGGGITHEPWFEFPWASSFTRTDDCISHCLQSCSICMDRTAMYVPAGCPWSALYLWLCCRMWGSDPTAYNRDPNQTGIAQCTAWLTAKWNHVLVPIPGWMLSCSCDSRRRRQ